MLIGSPIACWVVALAWRVIINTAYVTDPEAGMGDRACAAAAGPVRRTRCPRRCCCCAGSVLYFGIKFYERLQLEREATLAASALAQEAQLKMLRYQLNPHFLFNTLNAISTLVLDDQNRIANLAVSRLSEFLRYTLDQDPMKKVTLRQELDALNLYLGIEKLRFGERLRLEFDVDERSGVRARAVAAAAAAGRERDEVRDRAARGGRRGHRHRRHRGRRAQARRRGRRSRPAAVGSERGNGRGVGLRNTRERLKVLYGDAHSRRGGGRIGRDCASRCACRWKSESDGKPDTRDHRRRRAAGAPRPGTAPRDLSDIEIVAQCANGREAVDAVARHAPDLMFLDIQMPGIDGFEVLRGFRRPACRWSCSSRPSTATRSMPSTSTRSTTC